MSLNIYETTESLNFEEKASTSLSIHITFDRITEDFEEVGWLDSLETVEWISYLVPFERWIPYDIEVAALQYFENTPSLFFFNKTTLLGFSVEKDDVAIRKILLDFLDVITWGDIF